MTAPVAVFVSFRFGGTDGVSVEARKWEWALGQLGFRVRRVAGELIDGLRPDDTWIPFLAIEPSPGAHPEPDALAASIAGTDLVVVENLCSLPLNIVASTMTAEVLAAHDGRVAFHHHDLPWERPHLAHLAEFPPRRANSLHITVNDTARRSLADRGIEARTIRNAFDLDPIPGNRDDTRTTFGLGASDVVVLQPTRAIPRKEVGRGIEFSEHLGELVADRPLRYWLTGAAEEGFGPELEQLLSGASVPVTRGAASRVEDAYAACDVVVFPSSREGFGNPVIEGTIAGRPVAVASYPVLDELVSLGLDLFSVDDPERVAGWLQHPDTGVLESNRACLQDNFDLADLPDRVRAAFATVGWDVW
jgi:mannosylglucosylglycerate synthase